MNVLVIQRLTGITQFSNLNRMLRFIPFILDCVPPFNNNINHLSTNVIFELLVLIVLLDWQRSSWRCNYLAHSRYEQPTI